MKSLTFRQLITSFYLLILMALPCSLFSTTYTAVVSGNWDSALTWGGNMPGNSITGEDQIIISAGVTVNMNVDVEVNHQLALMTLLGNLESTEHSLTLTAGTIAGTGELLVKELTIGAMGTVATTGNIFCDVFETSSSSLVLQSSLHVSQRLKLMAGECQLGTDGEIMLNAGSTVQVGGGSLLQGEGSIQAMGAYNLLYTQGADTTGAETTVGTIAKLTLQLSSILDTLTLGSNLTVTDTAHLAIGTFALNGYHVTLEGAVMNETNAAVHGDLDAGITIKGSANATIIFSENGGELDTLIIDQNGAAFTLGSDLTVHLLLQIEQGECVLDGNHLTINASLQTGAGATITTDGDATLQLDGMGNVTVSLTDSTSALGVLVINQTGGNVSFNTNLVIADTLNLMQGHLVLLDNDLILGANASISGGNEDHYIQTSGAGTLNISLVSEGNGALFPVGSGEGYFPCIIAQNQNGSDTQIEVRVMPGVFAQGETGADLTTSESLVNHTWLISQTDANASIDLDFEFFWKASAAVNGFDPDHCFISHYTNNEWDVQAAAKAMLHADGSYSISRENITSLSPFRVKDQMASAISTSTSGLLFFKSYPNPAQDHINIELPEGLAATALKIFDRSGRLVLQKDLEKGASLVRIPLDGWEPGLYLIKMEGAVGERFVKE